jgi:zinc/manganese transport system substrate-binding protein
MAGAVASCGQDGEQRTAAAGGGSESDGAGAIPVAVVATTSIWADVVSEVACDGQVAVESIVPPGGDPHSFEPSLADRADLEAAALVVANGLFLEESLVETIDAVAEGGTPVFAMADHIETIDYATGDDGHDDGHGDGEHGGDPHVWFDPVRVSGALPALADQLVDEAGLDAGAVDACLDA